MKLVIDTNLCTGHGRCYEVSPDLFVDDDEGYGQVSADDVSADQLGSAQRAVAACPERAISLVD